MDEAPQPAAPTAFDDPQLEALYQQTRQVAGAAQSQSGGLVLIGSLALFVVLQMSDGATWTTLLLLVGTLLFHESGHWLGMRLFGYRDVKMFFIPFFGAAVSGKRSGVAAWKQAVVLLLGPLPGIVLGAVLLVLAAAYSDPTVRQAALMMVLLNAFNLLPLGGLDGGLFFRRLLFSRQRHLEVVFMAATGFALFALAAKLRFFFLALFAALGMLAIPRRHRILGETERLRRERGAIGADVALLDDADRRALFVAARTALPETQRAQPRSIAVTMDELADAAQPAPGVGATIVLLLGWITGFLLALVLLVSLAVAHVARWKPHVDPVGHFSVDVPSTPLVLTRPSKTPAGLLPAHMTATRLDLVKRFTVAWVDVPAPTKLDDAWMTSLRDSVGREIDAAVIHEDTVRSNGLIGREVRYASNRRVWRGHFFVIGQRVYEVFASAPELDNDASRFLDSFKIVSAGAVGP